MTIHNHIHIVGHRRKVSSILSRHFTEDGTLDLNTIIPMPDKMREYWTEMRDYDASVRHILTGDYYIVEELFPGINNCCSLAEAIHFLQDTGEYTLAERVEYENYLAKTYGFMDDINWAWANWGSGRNAEQGILDEVSFVSNGDSWFKARFITSDCAPLGAIRKLSEMYPEVHIYLSYLDLLNSTARESSYFRGEEYAFGVCNVARMARTLFSIDVPQHMWCNALIDTPTRGYRAIRLS